MSFGAMPALQDEVSVVGYPEGGAHKPQQSVRRLVPPSPHPPRSRIAPRPPSPTGEGISITMGVVSRIEIQRYVHSGSSLLAVQIDAAINPGNSGGPAVDESGDVIGVAFQNQQDSQNIGYVIPVPTIQHFLADTAPDNQSGTSGFCSLGIFWQAMDNEQLRKFYRLPKAAGVRVRGVVPLAAAANYLKTDDIILQVQGHPIANDGSFAVGAQVKLAQNARMQTASACAKMRIAA